MGKNTAYTHEQEKYLIENAYGITRKELTDRFNVRFSTDKSVLTIKSWCNNRKLYSGTEGKFKKNSNPWNKGKTGDAYTSHYGLEKIMNTCQKMHEANRTAVIGEERIIRGVPHIRMVTGRANRYDIWKRKRLVVWESVHGAIPKGHCVVHLDGNRLNCDLSNLTCIPKQYMTLLSKNQWFAKNPIITETAIKWCELHYACKS
jgi:hypothetical protein